MRDLIVPGHHKAALRSKNTKSSFRHRGDDAACNSIALALTGGSSLFRPYSPRGSGCKALSNSMASLISRSATRLAYGASQLPRLIWYAGHGVVMRQLSKAVRRHVGKRARPRASADAPVRRRASTTWAPSPATAWTRRRSASGPRKCWTEPPACSPVGCCTVAETPRLARAGRVTRNPRVRSPSQWQGLLA